MNNKAVIQLKLNGNNLIMKRNLFDKITWHEEKIIFENESVDHREYVTYWILNRIKPLFFNMPIEKIVIDCAPEVMQKYKNNLMVVDRIVVNTNNFLKRIVGLKNMAEGYKNILFYDLESDERSKFLYEDIKTYSSNKVEYKTFNPGFNPVKRKWEKAELPQTLESLINYIKENEISKIVSINQYLLENYLNCTGVYLIGVLHFLSIEYIIYDYDEYSQGICGYMRKDFFNCDKFSRISHTCWHETFDQRLKLHNIHYSIIPQNFSDENPTEPLRNDYNLIVLSHCRLKAVKSMLRPILFFLDLFDNSNLLANFQLWYCSLFYMIQHIMKLDEFQVHHYNRILTTFFYHLTNFLKYEIVSQLVTERNIFIYGDEGWQEIFPQYYQGYINTDEKMGLIKSGQYLFLLMNWSALYTSTNGPVYDAVSYRMPFINYPVFVKTPELEGLKHIEYENFDDLNKKADNINSYYSNPELLESLHYYRSILQEEQTYVAAGIANGKSLNTFNGEYGRQRKELNRLFEEKVVQYIDCNEEMLRETFNILVVGKPTNYDVSKSKWLQRSYIKRMTGINLVN